MATADGRTKHYAATITHDASTDLGDGTFLVAGHIESRARCMFLRVVTLRAHYLNGHHRLLDIIFTGFSGAWASKADLTGVDRVKATVRKGRGIPGLASITAFAGHGHHHHHHKVVCDKASFVFAAP
ncbi:MAG: hypothetical protein ACRDK1_06135 [Solirubrobacterales bacterium]